MKKNYLPRKEKDFLLWCENFLAKSTDFATQLNIVAATITELQTKFNAFKIVMSNFEKIDNFYSEYVSYKNLLLSDTSGKTLKAPVISTLTAITDSIGGLKNGISLLVKNIKSQKNYTEAIGQAMGIIGEEMGVDFANIKPEISLSITGGSVVLKWSKGQAEALNVYVDRGTGSYSFLATDAKPDYTDKTSLPDAATTWKYKCIYVVDDEEVGQFSDEKEILVKKFV